MRNITVILTQSHLTCIAELVRKGMYPSRSEAVRMAVNDLIKRELSVEERRKLIGLEAGKA